MTDRGGDKHCDALERGKYALDFIVDIGCYTGRSGQSC